MLRYVLHMWHEEITWLLSLVLLVDDLAADPLAELLDFLGYHLFLPQIFLQQDDAFL